MSFLTLEDVNGTLYRNQGFYWHEINTNNIKASGTYENVKVDFCKVSRRNGAPITTVGWLFLFKIDNNYWTKGYYVLDEEGNSLNEYATWTAQGYLSVNMIGEDDTPNNIRLFLYMGINQFNNVQQLDYFLETETLDLNFKELNTEQTIYFRKNTEPDTRLSVNASLNKGYNLITSLGGGYGDTVGYLLVNLLKSDFQFNCNQQLTLGKVNTVKLGTATDYKPNGDMIGANTPTIKVLYKDTYIPVVWNSSQNDYCFDIDLTNKENESNIRFKVLIEANDVINASETQVSLPCKYEGINNLTKLTTLFRNGGVGRLTSNITLNNDLTVTKSVYIIGNDKTLTMQGHKIVVPSDKTFKADKLTFTGGTNTIQQQPQSKAELTECNFTNCTGLGAVIDCQVDIGSLENATDFTTILTDCTFTNNDMCILHGGDLTVTGCNVTGKIGNKDYPYFLYQTDGTATITNTSFELSSNTQISTDIEFNSCIFICGENAVIDNGNHSEWQTNNITGFLENSRNTSTINVTYYYDAIEDYITLQSNNGYCHSVSGADYVFKTNVTLNRGE